MVADDVFFVLFCVGNLPILARPARKIKQEARLRRGSWLDEHKNQKKRASERAEEMLAARFRAIGARRRWMDLEKERIGEGGGALGLARELNSVLIGRVLNTGRGDAVTRRGTGR
jgi:hypothetical protein